MIEETQGEWLECVIDKDFEIFTEYPHPLRRKGRDRIIKERTEPTGYVRVVLNHKQYMKHRIVAQQFIENDDPENKTQVDHINHIRSDNRIENLRWCSVSENNKNRTGCGHKFVFIDKLPETAESLDAYNGREFDGVYVDYTTKKFYLWNGLRYRELIPYRMGGNLYYGTYDLENKWANISHKVLFG